MPRYFFNLYDDCVLIDEEGAELPTVDVARQRALHFAREMACQEVLEGKLTLSHRIEVEDEDRKPIVVIPFGDAVTVEE